MSTTNIPVFNDTLDTIQRPQWLDEQLYPFQSHFVEIDGNRIHSIDEGSGPTLMLLHPGVGWSFMYSDIIPALLISGDLDGTIKLGWLARLERIFPRHRTIILKGSHHFPQIYDSAAVADAIHSFWDEVVTAS